MNNHLKTEQKEKRKCIKLLNINNSARPFVVVSLHSTRPPSQQYCRKMIFSASA